MYVATATPATWARIARDSTAVMMSRRARRVSRHGQRRRTSATAARVGYSQRAMLVQQLCRQPGGTPGHVYLGGAYSYTTYGFSTNGRAFLYSTDAGASFTDMTWDATTNPTPAGSCCQPNPIAPNGMHPDQHALVRQPTNPVSSSTAPTAASCARAAACRHFLPVCRFAGSAEQT